MKLVQKLSAVLLTVIIVSAAVNFLVLRAFVTPSFTELERKTARQNAERVVDALNAQLTFLYSTARDWSYWDDTYNYARGEKPDYAENNLYFDSLNSLQLNSMFVIDASRKVLWGKSFDLSSGEEIDIPELSQDGTKIDQSLLHTADSNKDDLRTGLFMTSKGPMLVASAPILKSSNEGPAAGSFIFARLLTDAVASQLRDQTHVEFDIVNLRTDTKPDAVPATANYLLQTGEKNITVFHTLKDMAQAPALIIAAKTARDISAVGQSTLYTALAALLGASVIVLLASGVIIQMIAIGPIRSLTDTVLQIAKTGNLKEPVALKRNDEIGILSQEFQSMLSEVATVRDHIAEQSYLSGISQTLGDVMHNVKNTLNPIPLNVELSLRRLSSDRDPLLLKAVAELQEPDTDPDRRQKLASYLNEAINQAAAERSELTKSLKKISVQSHQVEEFLNEHSLIDENASFSQEVDLLDLIREAQLVIPEDADIEVAVEMQEAMQPVSLNPVVLKQVLGNVLLNAHEAIAAADMANGKIRCRIATRQIDDQDVVSLSVIDNGQGVTAENLERIFERGFSTRKQKSGGLGLHWCANNIARLGGNMSINSDGAGKGTLVEIVVPVGVNQRKVA